MQGAAVVLGVVGGPGVGKSVFVDEMRRLGAKVIRADDVASQVVRKDPEVRKNLRKEFGDSFFDRIGRLKRRALAKMVFSDPAEQKKLNRIVWPAMIEAVDDAVARIRSRNPENLIVLEMAVLFQSGYDRSVDRIVQIEAPMEQRKNRLARQRNWTGDEIRIRIDAADKADAGFVNRNGRKADWTIENKGSLADLREETQMILKQIQSENQI